MAIVDPRQQNILASQALAQPLNPLLPTVVPAPVPTVPAAVPSPEETATILGMTPEQFQAIVGGIGQALAPPDTWQARLGEFAKQLGQGQIVGGLTGQDITGSELKPKTPAKAAKKSKLEEVSAIPTKLDLSETLLGG